MGRHNRRRTRPRSNHSSRTPTWPLSEIRTPQTNYLELVSPDTSCRSRSPVATPAPSWHNGYTATAWQTRERLRDFGLEEQQRRLFGGEPGDDVSLCGRMLEYFVGLDYIDS